MKSSRGKYLILLLTFTGIAMGAFSQAREKLKDFVLNPVSNQPIEYFIVSDPLYREILQPFIEWKTRQGFRVTAAFTDTPGVGTTEYSIRQYLQQQILSFQAKSPIYIMLAGDVNQIPPRMSGGHITDFYYGEFNGDLLPEAYVGRFPAKIAVEMKNQLDKTICYEQYNFPNTSFLSRGLFVAGDDIFHSTGCNGAANYVSGLFSAHSDGNRSISLIAPAPQGDNYTARIIDELNTGVALLTYDGHANPWGWSSPSFMLSDLDKLQENKIYPFMIVNSCQSADFSQDCLAAALMKCRDKGAVAYIGATSDTYWDEDYWWNVGYKALNLNPVYESHSLGSFDRLFHMHNEPFTSRAITAGQILAAGNISVAASGSEHNRLYWETYCLLGDPSLMPYLSVPEPLDVNYPNSLKADDRIINILTLPYAYLALSYNGKLLDARNADSLGKADLKIPLNIVTGPLQLMGIAQNHIPFSGIIHFNDKTLTADTYPNPFTLSFTICFTLIAAESLSFDICDISGKVLKEIISSRNFEPGFNTLNVNALELPGGIYFLRITSNKGINILKISKS